MSAQAAVAQLPQIIKGLVLSVAKEGQDFGTSEKDKAEVSGWIEKVAKANYAQESSIKELDGFLTSRTFLVGNTFSAADVALYAALHPIISQETSAQYYAHPVVTRYFDHVQSLPAVRGASNNLTLVTFDLDGMPKLERKADPPKKKEKKDKAPKDAPEATPTAKASDSKGEVQPSKGEKKEKEKKEKKGGDAKQGGKAGDSSKSGGGKAAPDDSGPPVPSMIDLRIGRIVEIAKHPDADSLYVEQIDFGEETGPRTVVSGLVNYIPIEQMRDKILVGVCNLKPANMRGVKSHAMVLCATSPKGKEGGIELVQPPEGAKPGDRVYFEGEQYESANPLAQLNPKKKIFETIQPGFTILETHEAAWVDPATKSVHKIRTKDGICVAPTFIGASLS